MAPARPPRTFSTLSSHAPRVDMRSPIRPCTSPRTHVQRVPLVRLTSLAALAAPALAAALLATPAPARAQQRPMTPDDVLAIRTVSDPQISPDGRWVAYVVS